MQYFWDLLKLKSDEAHMILDKNVMLWNLQHEKILEHYFINVHTKWLTCLSHKASQLSVETANQEQLS
jgi:hypothetical protein